jgi:hypothetical protein
MKQLVAGFTVAATFAVSASAMAGVPIRMTDAQMDQVVAGATFTDQITTVDVTMDYYHGYSNNVAPGPGPGTSSVETTTTTTFNRTLDCTGNNQNSCYTGTGLNPNTTVVSTVQVGNPIVETKMLSGPGASFGVRF